MKTIKTLSMTFSLFLVKKFRPVRLEYIYEFDMIDQELERIRAQTYKY